MSPKNTTINKVFAVVQSQGQQIRDVLSVVQTQGQQIGEVLEAVHLLAEQMDKRFEQVNERFEQVNERFESTDSRVATMDSMLKSITSQMVTKHYLDDKLADLRGDLTLLTHKEDDKLLALVELLYGKRLMTEEERKHIKALQPFAIA